MNNTIYISKKMEKLLKLFENKTVSFSKVMEVGRYRNPDTALNAIKYLMKLQLINVSLWKSNFIKL